MADATTTLAELKDLMRRFVEERQWQPFHSPKNLVMGLSVEAAELMEHYLWVEGAASYSVTASEPARTAVADEIADVTCYLLALSNVLGIDLSDAVRAKMVKTAQKYPADQYRGKYRID
jgi:dCTP diphosphatase